MQGRCSECGLDFAWGDVLDPSRVELSWYVEHAKATREMIVRTIPTLWYLLFPNRYWRRLGMEAPRSLKRFVLWVGAMMLTLHLLTSAGFVLTNYIGMSAYNAQIRIFNANAKEAGQSQLSLHDLDGFDYWYPIIGESILTPVVTNQIWTEGFAFGAGMFGVVCLGISVMWMVLFGLFPTTRKRTKLRMVHVVRAMVVGGILPILAFEIGRVFDLLVHIGEFSKMISSVEFVLGLISVPGVIWMLIWIQWFWIAGVRIGWKVKANWFEMLLVMLASFFGLVFAGLMFVVLRMLGEVIKMAAQMVGIV